MAATDKTYRDQGMLDKVFAASCVLMLASLVLMFVQDFNREFKRVQRTFRDVDEALTERAMLERLPDPAKYEEATRKAAEARGALDVIKEENKAKLQADFTTKAKREAEYQAIKADYDSIMSLYNIDVERVGEESDPSMKKVLDGTANQRKAEVENLATKLAKAQTALDNINRDLDSKLKSQKDAEKQLSKAEDELKRISGEFDRFAKLTAQKKWNWGDNVRRLPIIDGFASPLKIQQYTLDDYPIDYSFKLVTRYDRCTSCHLGMERGAFDKISLAKLTPTGTPDDLQEKLDDAREILLRRAQRKKMVEGADGKTRILFADEPIESDEKLIRWVEPEEMSWKPTDLPASVRTMKLSLSQIQQFAAHPRLDLFVDANSPHPVEKFGCTSCHSGQGSSTDFLNATHTPNTAAQKEKWEHELGWHHIHFWDFPMSAKRFNEASCIKCHHEVTDLAGESGKTEYRPGLKREGSKLAEVVEPTAAPGNKVLRGYNLVREFGCFGCHEISGYKGGRKVGPDLRLEPTPPIESLAPAEKAKALADTANPPGTLRKVGPSLYRLSEKTNPEWTRKWVESPRDFRPNTKMPHFYGLSNNSPETLPDDQKNFPAAEIASISYYLHYESDRFLEGKDKEQRDLKAKIEALEARKADLSQKELAELAELARQQAAFAPPIPISKEIRDWEDRLVQVAPLAAQPNAEQLKRGRQLFTEKGCLACHMHDATTKADANFVAVDSKATHGPDLSRVAAKLRAQIGGAEGGHRWLVQWLLNPNYHSPRTRMPITYLSVAEASDIAAWLLRQPAAGWAQPDVAEPTIEALAKLAEVYLLKAPGVTRTDAEQVLGKSADKRRGFPSVKHMPPDADERMLLGELDENKLKWYIGRKAVNRLGCYACHSIPGFASAKPIGTHLNDWGKKDAERLAFEDIHAFMSSHYEPVESMKDADGHGPKAHGDKLPYDSFFYEAVEHHQREGFLHQKLVEPRSYDYKRLRTWDDRLRMPQFKFARDEVKPLPGETDKQAEARAEAEAREAVMTFVLGLVAEPVPPKYLYNPPLDKMAEVKGRQIIDKYNCAGCHEVKPGVYEFKKTPESAEQLKSFYELTAQSRAGDHFFPDHSAWVAPPQPHANRYLARGVLQPAHEDDNPNQLLVRLMEAFRFTDSEGKSFDIPSGSTVGINKPDLVSQQDTLGGAFAYLLSGHLARRDPVLFKDPKNARAALPPPLIREGEKVQPGWLFQFLKNPGRIRPMAVLRMPRFNMSEEEAQALVNYFAGIDRQINPAAGVVYPYANIPQKDESLWSKRNEAYVKHLSASGVEKEHVQALAPTWSLMLQQQVVDLEARLQIAEGAVKSAKADTAKQMAEQRDSIKKELEQTKEKLAKKDFKDLDEAWKAREAYAADAYRALANYNNACLSCHQVGNLQPAQAQGPALQLTAERLRPEWTLRWISNPERLLSYPTPMPQNFAATQKDDKGNPTAFKELWAPPRQQAEAVRDVLMILPQAADMPVNRYYRSPPAGEGAKQP